jgi:Ca-activated chloride channel family protein
MFRFEHPDWIYLLWLLPVLLLVLGLYFSWRKKALARLGDPALVEKQLPARSKRRIRLYTVLIFAGITLLALAAANPQRGSKKRQVKQKSADVFILFDVSQSMHCQDLPPSRLQRARAFALKLLDRLEGERVGLIFFAGSSYLQMPLSTDYSAARLFIQNADDNMVSEQGTAIATAIEQARTAFDPEPGGGRALVIITDGENHDEESIDAAGAAYDDGIIVYAVGAGTTQGGPIPVGGGQFKRDQDAQIVRTKMNRKLLESIADAGKGSAFLLQNEQKALRVLDSEIDQLEKREVAVRSYADYDSFFQYLLLPGLLLLLLAEYILTKKSGKHHAE